MQHFKRWALHPLVVLACLLAGGVLGVAAPSFSKNLGIVGVVYVDLLKMIVLPFMLSAVIFSLQQLYRDGGAGRIIKKVVVVFAAISMGTAILAATGSLLLRPGSDLPRETLAALGNIISIDANQTNTEMSLRVQEEPPRELSVQDVVNSLIPANIFASLANGESLKALVFALLFGFAVGQVPTRMAAGLSQALETIYGACETLTRWINLPIPLVLVCMTASQIAVSGLEPLKAMGGFVAAFVLVSAVLLALALWLLVRRASVPLSDVVIAMREPFALGIATNNSATCMPAMVSGLVDKLHFPRSRVELLVPLSISLLRMGPVAYYVCGTLFIAALYGHPVTAVDTVMLMLVSVMLGFASSGMAGIVTISLIGTTCSYLGLPFEAAFLLFAAVDPVCAMARTTVTVMTGCAAVAMICPKPVQL
ncbi:dicarboxylate/amino acid:cation symporter [Noviherbaspirillum galbum]|uniref:Dicarboxylate/amino acid:cation symporter n=1 Tax=Noviherbaspirillum galbum TaxID=2709383 RepID=A0A6B3SYU1_9BURK|nr:cation:dicarboxylase symporter family transporter [Noviherbaspirillum galbum]NEX64806.1 dicarboxylate/amino acid:cation symporter [Noviherbaspirillum galbum]